MEVRQLFDPISCTYTYLAYDQNTKDAVLIDPVFEFFLRDDALIQELGLTLKYTLETHIHADHVTSAWLFKIKRNSEIAISRESGAKNSDRLLSHGDIISVGQSKLTTVATPGHTNGCVSYLLGDQSAIFTGDALLVRGTGRTDFQEGSSIKLFKSITNAIFSLPDNCIVYPAHDYAGIMSSTIGEEKQFNPRLGGMLSEADFVKSMEHLNLPHPKKIDAAVPANSNCGYMDEDFSFIKQPSWAHLKYTFADNWDIESPELFRIKEEVFLIDVRSEKEFSGALGRISNSINLPLETINAKIMKQYKGKPVVFICRAGGRSVQALKNADLVKKTEAASLRGGLIAWRSEGFEVENGSN
jgi:glyoxylase-like metal-dependent hydrolase (beta-lactamase superfamily II)/rhodanese-related sulfurtransferase